MLCQNCKKNEATVFYEENINGRKKSYTLCADCAAKKGVEIPDFGREMLNFGGNIFGNLLGGAGVRPSMLAGFGGGLTPRTEEQKRCPVCGSTLADITRNGRLGCGECYTVFGGMPLPKPRKHICAENNAAGEEKPLSESERKELEEKLKEAVASENYEEAARLRDILRGNK